MHSVTVPASSTIASRSAERGGVRQRNSSARPGVANQAASPVSHRLTAAPEATPAAATVKPWLHRSGSASPTVTFTTRLRVMPRP